MFFLENDGGCLNNNNKKNYTLSDQELQSAWADTSAIFLNAPGIEVFCGQR